MEYKKDEQGDHNVRENRREASIKFSIAYQFYGQLDAPGSGGMG
jgi:hypothetical protein